MTQTADTVNIVSLENQQIQVYHHISWSLGWQVFYVWIIYHMNQNKTVRNPSVPANDFSIHLLYRNALDIHNKHATSHIHVDICVSKGHHSVWISTDKCDMSTECLKCVTPADVASVGDVR